MSNVTIYSGKKKVVSQGAIIVANEDEVKFVLFENADAEFTVFVRFLLVDEVKDAKVPVAMSPVGDNAVDVTFSAVRDRSGMFISKHPFAESDEIKIYGSFRVKTNVHGVIDFGFTFMTEDKKASTPAMKNSKKGVVKKNANKKAK